MTGRCSKCKEHCEAELDNGMWPYSGKDGRSRWVKLSDPKWLSNCCGAPLIEDGERSTGEE